MPSDAMILPPVAASMGGMPQLVPENGAGFGDALRRAEQALPDIAGLALPGEAALPSSPPMAALPAGLGQALTAQTAPAQAVPSQAVPTQAVPAAAMPAAAMPAETRPMQAVPVQALTTPSAMPDAPPATAAPPAPAAPLQPGSLRSATPAGPRQPMSDTAWAADPAAETPPDDAPDDAPDSPSAPRLADAEAMAGEPSPILPWQAPPEGSAPEVPGAYIPVLPAMPAAPAPGLVAAEGAAAPAAPAAATPVPPMAAPGAAVQAALSQAGPRQVPPASGEPDRVQPSLRSAEREAAPPDAAPAPPPAAALPEPMRSPEAPRAPEQRAPDQPPTEARSAETLSARAPDMPQDVAPAEAAPPPQAQPQRSPPLPPGRQLLPVTVALLVSPGSQPAFSITLEPQELGRVEVRLARGADGETKLRITAERPETVALLARDQRDLQQGLALSGVALPLEAISVELAGGDAQREGRQDGQPRRQAQAGPEPLAQRAETPLRSLLDMSI